MPKRSLSGEQKKEIDILTNAGVNRETLAREYGVSIHTIRACRYDKKNKTRSSVRARTPAEKFRYAQDLYADNNTPSRIRECLDRELFEPIVGCVETYVLEEPLRTPICKLVAAIIGKPIERSAFSCWDADNAHHYSKGAVLGNLLSGRRYLNSAGLVVDSVPLVRGQLEANLPHEIKTKSEKRIGDLIKKIDQTLGELSHREREITKLRYGIGDGHTYSLDEIGRKFRATRERVRQIEASAIRKLSSRPVPKISQTQAVSTDIVARSKSRWDYENESPCLLNLSLRTRRVLERLGADTICKMSNLSVEDIISTRNGGREVIDEIETALKSYGLSLRIEI